MKVYCLEKHDPPSKLITDAQIVEFYEDKPLFLATCLVFVEEHSPNYDEVSRFILTTIQRQVNLGHRKIIFTECNDHPACRHDAILLMMWATGINKVITVFNSMQQQEEIPNIYDVCIGFIDTSVDIDADCVIEKQF